MSRRLPSLILLPVVQYAFHASAMDRELCNAHIVQKLNNGTLHPNDTIFFFDGHKHMSAHDNIGLTIQGCRDQCGAKSDWYHDVGPRLTTWLIPVIVLIGNMQLATLGKRNSIMTLLHLIGDPIDSCWSLLTKLEVWNRCYDQAVQLSRIQGQNEDHVRDRGTILAAIQELEGPGSNPMQMYNDIIQGSTIDGDDSDRPALHHLCRETANELSDSNSLQLPRTWLAVLSYVVTVLSAFVEAVGGKPSSQPGGRIGTAMFMSWLLPVVLLSNTVGAFTSRRTCLRVMERFAKATKPVWRSSSIDTSSPYTTPRWGGRSPPGPGTQKGSPLSHRRGSSLGEVLASPTAPPPPPPMWLPSASLSSPLMERGRQDYFPVSTVGGSRKPSFGQTLSPGSRDSSRRRSEDWLDLQLFSQERPSKIGDRVKSYTPFSKAQPWYGAIYTYQPSKKLFSVPGKFHLARGSRGLLTLSVMPVFLSLLFAFLIIWFTPTIGLTCRHFPLIGIFLAWVLSATFTEVCSHFVTGKYHWYFVITKDALIAIPSLAMIFLSSSGLFNSCWCWSAVYSRGLANAVVLLDPDPLRKHNAETIYPGLVGACIALQAAVFLFMISLSKRGRSLLRRVEKTKESDFWKLHRPGDANSGKGERPRAGSESIGLLSR